MSRLENPTWAVGITTAPRQRATLLDCLDSLRVCGWNEEVHVFAEPGNEILAGDDWKFTVHRNEVKLGCYHNWLSSARWLVENTQADVIMTVQDDAFFHPDSRRFAEANLWPSERTGFLSLYTPKHYAKEGVHRVLTSSLWGTVAVIWPREVLRQAVNHTIAKTWMGIHHKSRSVMERRRNNPSLVNNADYVIGKIINALQLEMWFVTPSPVSHIAKVSTINHGGNAGRRNCLPCADHNVPLAIQVAQKRITGRDGNRRPTGRVVVRRKPIMIERRMKPQRVRRTARRAVPARRQRQTEMPRQQEIRNAIARLQAQGI